MVDIETANLFLAWLVASSIHFSVYPIYTWQNYVLSISSKNLCTCFFLCEDTHPTCEVCQYVSLFNSPLAHIQTKRIFLPSRDLRGRVCILYTLVYINCIMCC